MWSAYRRLGSIQSFPARYGDFVLDGPYPATSRVAEGSVTLAGVMGVMRDYYEGTEFDMTVGMAAGPFGSPDRFGGSNTPGEAVEGRWERTIATHRSICSLVIESRSWLPDAVGGTLWFAPHAAHGSLFVPFSAGAARAPDAYSRGWCVRLFLSSGSTWRRKENAVFLLSLPALSLF